MFQTVMDVIVNFFALLYAFRGPIILGSLGVAICWVVLATTFQQWIRIRIARKHDEWRKANRVTINLK